MKLPLLILASASLWIVSCAHVEHDGHKHGASSGQRLEMSGHTGTDRRGDSHEALRHGDPAERRQ